MNSLIEKLKNFWQNFLLRAVPLKKLPKWLYAVIAIGCLLIGYGLWPRGGKPQQMTAESNPTSTRDAKEDLKGMSTEALTITKEKTVVMGVLFGKREITIKAKAQGEVMELRFEEGSWIKEGDIIALIDDRQKSIERELASVEFDSAAKDFAKSKTLGKFISKDDLEQKRSAMIKKKSTFQLKEVDLANSRVSGPMGGVITKIYIDKGETVAIGDKVAELVQIEDLILQANIPSRLIKSFISNSEIQFTVPDVSGQKFKGKVQFVSPVIDAATDTVRVKFLVSNQKDHEKRFVLKPGMVAYLVELEP